MSQRQSTGLCNYVLATGSVGLGLIRHRPDNDPP